MITSTHNAKLQRIRALNGRRQEREQAGAFVVEGVRLVEEALASNWQPELVLYSRQISTRGSALLEQLRSAGVEVEETTPDLLASVSDTETPQGILAIFPARVLPLPDPLNFVLIVDSLRDPGNLGTLLRSAAAAGCQAALLTPGTTDPFAPKVLRAAMGAHFRLPLQYLSFAEIQSICSLSSLNIYLAEAETGSPCWDLDLCEPVALLVGSEAEGASAEAHAIASGLITIPMPGRSESLNAAVAASILLFEVVRQRSILQP